MLSKALQNRRLMRSLGLSCAEDERDADKIGLALAELVASTFKRCRVADVGGGSGTLTKQLRGLGFCAVNIDPQGSGAWCVRREYDPGLDRSWPLVIGLHPHEATMRVALAAVLQPVVIVPCCAMRGKSSEAHIRELWTKLGIRWTEHRLARVGRELGSLAFVTLDKARPRGAGDTAASRTAPPRGPCRHDPRDSSSV